MNTLHLDFKTSQLVSRSKITPVCSAIQTKHKNALCGQNTEFLNVKPVVQIVTTGLIAKVKGHTICLSVSFLVLMAAFVKMMVTFCAPSAG